jgi:DNA mismatch endonuclease (patch repair protein)
MPATDPTVSARMKRVRRSDTEPELLLRKELFRRGLRYRLDVRPIATSRTKPDIVFPGPKVAVFVDGCFWHQCPEHGTMPKSNRSWWKEKLDANVARDRRADEALSEAGWTVIRVWEHDDVVKAAKRVQRALSGRI